MNNPATQTDRWGQGAINAVKAAETTLNKHKEVTGVLTAIKKTDEGGWYLEITPDPNLPLDWPMILRVAGDIVVKLAPESESEPAPAGPGIWSRIWNCVTWPYRICTMLWRAGKQA